MKIVLDSSTLISISSNCLMSIFTRYCTRSNIEAIITPSVYLESVSNPLNIKRFQLNAIRIKDAVDAGKINVAVKDLTLTKESERLMQIANNIASVKGKSLKLVHQGEAETLALMKKESAQVLAVDERTTRMLLESPEGMRSFLGKRYGEAIEISQESASALRNEIKGLAIIRSVELIALAYSANCFEPDLESTPKALEAALYAAKFAGCAVSFDEISEYLFK